MSNEDPVGAGASTPSNDPSPVSLDPNARYVIPGFDAPLKGEELRGGLLRQADYTRKTQELAAKARELDTFLATSQDALEIAALLSEDFDTAVETLRPIYGKQNTSMPQQPQYAPQGDPQPASEVAAVSNEVAALRQQNEQLQSQLYGFMANTQLTQEWKGLETRDPRMSTDAELRQRVSQVAAQHRLPLDVAYMVATYSDVQKQADAAKAEADAREMRRFIPSLGGGSRPSQEAPVSSEELFRKSFLESLKEEGFVK